MDRSQYNRLGFTKKYKEAFAAFYLLTSFSISAANIMYRTNTSTLSVDHSLPGYTTYDDIDTFVITTSADPENTIVYTSETNLVNINVNDGGFF
jgi:hypothetical protein